jgi:hypothetical protein
MIRLVREPQQRGPTLTSLNFTYDLILAEDQSGAAGEVTL